MTSTLVKASSSLTVSLEYTIEGYPDRSMGHADKTAMYRPQSVIIILTSYDSGATGPDRSTLTLSSFTIHGQRIRKSGDLGAGHRERLYRYMGGLPEWGNALVAKALGEAQGSVHHG